MIRTRLFVVAIGVAVVGGTVSALIRGATASPPSAPIISSLSPTATFAAGSNAQDCGLAQDTSCTFKAVDGVTAPANYSVVAAVDSFSNMVNPPVVSVVADPATDQPGTVYFRVHVVAGPGDVSSLSSSATVQVTVSSSTTGLNNQHSFTVNSTQQ